MTKTEEILIGAIKICSKDKSISALLLQDYVSNHGPLSNEAGEIVKKILANADK